MRSVSAWWSAASGVNESTTLIEFRIQPGTPWAKVQYFFYRATEPILAPVRRVIRPIGNLDISFMVVFLVGQFVVVPVLLR
jgi:uncharacterized protein YggT (Ycf19 family)